MISGILSQLAGRFGRGAKSDAPNDSRAAASGSLPLPIALWEGAGESDVWAAYYQRCIVEERAYLARNDAEFVTRTDHGCRTLSEEDLPRYAALYGGHHLAKLTAAFAAADLGRLSGKTVEIYDWGCGQAMASCLLMDFLRELCVRVSVRRVTLIEPGTFALERGTELLSRTLERDGEGKAYIRSICARFDALKPDTVRTASPGDVKIHLFSNILDIGGLDTWRLVKLLAQGCPGRNEFVCVSPRYRPSRLIGFYRDCHMAFGPAVTGFSHRQDDLRARIFDVRRCEFRERRITRDEVRFVIEIPPAGGGKNGGAKDEIADPIGSERLGTWAGRALRRFFRGY